jgi:hypothetical protein
MKIENTEKKEEYFITISQFLEDNGFCQTKYKKDSKPKPYSYRYMLHNGHHSIDATVTGEYYDDMFYAILNDDMYRIQSCDGEYIGISTEDLIKDLRAILNKAEGK